MTPQHLRQLADRTGLDGIAEALREAADEIDRLSAQPADVTDDLVEKARVETFQKTGADLIPEVAATFARAILALRPVQVPMTGEQWTDVLGSAGPDLLDLAKQWSDNKVHVYQVVNEAEKIVKAAVLRGITAQTEKEDV